MKTVKQQAEVSFKLLDFADKVVMLPIMNMLAESIKNQKNITIIVQETDISTYLTPEETNKTLKVLSDLGCRTSLGESYEDIVKSDNSQQKQEEQEEQLERCILQLFDTGQSKFETTRIIKDQLNLSMEDAKKLVDSCPIDIDLRKHKIKQPCYEHLFYALKKIGCTCSLTTKEQ